MRRESTGGNARNCVARSMATCTAQWVHVAPQQGVWHAWIQAKERWPRPGMQSGQTVKASRQCRPHDTKPLKVPRPWQTKWPNDLGTGGQAGHDHHHGATGSQGAGSRRPTTVRHRDHVPGLRHHHVADGRGPRDSGVRAELFAGLHLTAARSSSTALITLRGLDHGTGVFAMPAATRPGQPHVATHDRSTRHGLKPRF